MKHLLMPLLSAVAATTLCTIGCHLSGMSPDELVIAAAVSGSVSAAAALGAAFGASKKADQDLLGGP